VIGSAIVAASRKERKYELYLAVIKGARRRQVSAKKNPQAARFSAIMMAG
jgi:hypothetical protein